VGGRGTSRFSSISPRTLPDLLLTTNTCYKYTFPVLSGKKDDKMTDQPRLNQCYTIGHSNHGIDRFLELLQDTGTDTVIDVRSTPFSRFNPQFNRKNLEKSLKERAIGYIFMGDQLGGRYTDPSLLLPDGTVDYRKVQETERFREGISRLLAVISCGKTIALMCAEKEPERCHRFALISPVLQAKGISVVHIRPEGKSQANKELEQ
jgi:uncharacterized protein (DUF488 family)